MSKKLCTSFMDALKFYLKTCSTIFFTISLKNKRISKIIWGLFLISITYLTIANRRLDLVRACQDRLKAIVY